MSFLDLTDTITKMQNAGGSEAPVFGQGLTPNVNPAAAVNITNARIKYFVGNLSDEGDRLILEHIMTKSLQFSNLPNTGKGQTDPGGLLVIKEESTFNKEGDYVVAIKYLEQYESKPESSGEDRTLENRDITNKINSKKEVNTRSSEKSITVKEFIETHSSGDK